MSLAAMWSRVFDAAGVTFCSLVVAAVIQWWLADRLVGHRESLKRLRFACLLRALGSTISVIDTYFHGATTQVFSSAIVFLSWALIAGEVYRIRVDAKKTLRASETATILQTEAQLDVESVTNLAAYQAIQQDERTLQQSKELMRLHLKGG